MGFTTGKKAPWPAWRTLCVELLVFLLAACVMAGGRSQVLFAGGEQQGETRSPQVLVGLFRTKSVTLRSSGSWSLTSPTGERVSLKAGSSLTVSASGSRIAWEISGGGQKGSSGGNILISPASPQGPFISVVSAEGAGSSYSSTSFRGSIIVMADAGSLLVANAVDMEEYVQSVVGGETIGSWPLEVARAQAVAVRSYAAYKTGLRKDTLDRDYVGVFSALKPEDVLIWTSDQVYRGIGEETGQTVTAALSTRGEILTYQGLPAATYYHADAGGMTEDPCYVWGKGVPYLVPVAELPHESPHSFWTVTLTPHDLAMAADRLGVLLPGSPDVLRGLEQGVSGRWFRVLLASASAAEPVRGTDLRAVLPQVKSTLFSAYAVGGGRVTEGFLSTGMSFSVAGAEGVRSDVHLGSSYVIGSSGEALPLPLPESQPVTALSAQVSDGPPSVILQGSGWGHGVGLSQWGARGMALMGHDSWEILGLYYPETTPDKWW
ncbi:MAG TPA: SpoIID/LytB domain-containing protein [Firmicutes bacterium]|nr:SpoIID/LytB domain-containing protein [Candidatus Fermentithermobacillaceae bacterium]